MITTFHVSKIYPNPIWTYRVLRLLDDDRVRVEILDSHLDRYTDKGSELSVGFN